LMICKKIVDAYGGTISFTSLPEEGTKITFSLPLFTEEDSDYSEASGRDQKLA